MRPPRSLLLLLLLILTLYTPTLAGDHLIDWKNPAVYGILSAGDDEARNDNPWLGVGVRAGAVMFEVHGQEKAEDTTVESWESCTKRWEYHCSSFDEVRTFKNQAWGVDVNVAVLPKHWITPVVGVGVYSYRLEKTGVLRDSEGTILEVRNKTRSFRDPAWNAGVQFLVGDFQQILITAGYHSEREWYAGAGYRF